MPETDYESRKRRYCEVAWVYDKKMDREEFWLGMGWLRWWLLRKASGEILEVACGTGRNLRYYPAGSSLTLSDASVEMLGVAHTKAQELGSQELQPSYAVADIDSAVVPPMLSQGRQWDTVVDTFGLCSYGDPVEALRRMQRACKPGGQILLLEHGKSGKSMLDATLARGRDCHAANWGCIWDRDIDEIVRESGLIVRSSHRFHLGTTYYVVGEPCPESHAACE